MAEKGKMIRTKDVGIYSLTSTVKMHNGKPDVCFYISYKDGSGRKIWEKIGWRSEGIAQSTAAGKRRERMEALRLGAPVDKASRTITFGAAYGEWEKTHLPTLKDRYTVGLLAEKYILPRMKNRAMNSITPLDLDRMKIELGNVGLSPQTVKHILGIIRRVYRKALTWGIYYGPVPTDGVKMPKTDNARLRYLTKDEAKGLLDALLSLSPLWHDITLLSLHTGMRLSDILGLRTRQVNRSAGIIDVLEAKPGTYTVHLSKAAQKMLAGRMGNDPAALVFPSERGGGEITSMSKHFRKAVEHCKLNAGVTDSRYKVVFHTLRHTFASWLAQNGVPMSVIAALMGHSTLEMTQRYAKLAPDNKTTAVNTIDAILHD